MKHQVFGTLQKIGKSFMLPVAVLPIAGLLLGIGSTFTSTAYGSIVKEGGWLYKSLRVADSGNIVFGLLPLLFAVAIAIGLAQKSKEIAALSAVIAYFVMNMAIMSIVKNFMDLEKLNQTPGLISSFLGFENTMNTSVLGGVIIGLVVARLHNRYYKIKLPDMLSFFGGTHFIPIISACTAIAMGVVFAIIWPLLGQGIALLGIGIAKLGYFGSFLYGFILRALIPTGLHHVFYMPFWQTALGGTAEVNGTVLEGAQNILFAQLANGDVISPSVAKFYSGNYPIMMDQILTIDGFQIIVYCMPGHTDGTILYYANVDNDGILFTGDMFFVEGETGTDIKTGWKGDLSYNAEKLGISFQKLWNLNLDPNIILGGHGIPFINNNAKEAIRSAYKYHLLNNR